MAEIALRDLNTHCLDRRILDLAEMKREIAAWDSSRNGCPIPIQWRFTADNTRTKLRRLHPHR